MFTKRQAAVIYVVGALSVAFAGAVTWLELKEPPASTSSSETASFKPLPAFELTNQDGLKFSLDELKGKVWLADFVYTTCPGPCPIITAHMARIQRMLPPGDGVRLVSFSTDPDNDTPTVLKAYAMKFGAGDRWTFLTGPKEQVYGLINNGFLLPVAAPPGAQIIHSTRILLVDKGGTVRGIYDGTIETADGAIIADMQRLLKE
jgi:protein SCO1/2